MSDLQTLATTDIVVVGAGISGLCTAYELRKRGFDVVVVEQRFPAFGASGRNPGSIWLQTRRTGLELDLARAGKEKYAEYIAELGNVFEYRERGGLFFYETEEQGRVLHDYVTDRRAAGLDIDLLTRSEAQKHAPLLPATAIGAVFCSEDAQLDPQQFVTTLSAACVRAGVRKFDNTSVLSSLRDGDTVTGVRTVRGEIHASGVVWATGAWSVNLQAEGITLPVETARMGQIVTQPLINDPSAILHGPRGVAACGALTDLSSFEEPIFETPIVSGTQDGSAAQYDDSIAQNREGSLFIGSSIDGRGSLNPHISISATQAMISATMERYPEYAQYGVTQLWAGLTSETPDHLPIVDRTDGAYVNAGHAWGIASGPICGQVMAEIIAGEPSRFSSGLKVSRNSLGVAQHN